MNVTYIIGNGFDLNLGLKTSYKDFYAYYIEQYPSIHDEDKVKGNEKEIVKLKKSIQNSINGKNTDKANWADLELALGQYTSVFSAESEEEETAAAELMIDLIKDIRKELTAYLKEKVEQIQISGGEENALAEEFGNVDACLSKADYNKLNKYYKDHTGSLLIDIITLNYTSTLEKLLNVQGKESGFEKIGTKSILGKESFIKAIHHLHHTINEGDSPLLGVNDENQIANEALRKNEDLREFLIKQESNRMFGTEVDVDCKLIIESSQLLILFGVSIGATDKDWWNLIASHLLQHSDSRLIIFVYDASFIPGDPTLGKKRRKVVSEFLSHSGLADNNRVSVIQKITVVFNTPLFHGLRKFINISSYIKGEATFDYSNNNGRYTIGTGMRSFTTQWSEAGKDSIHAYNDSEDIEAIGLLNEPMSLDVLKIEDLDNVDFSSRSRKPELNDIVIWKNKHGHFAATKIVEIKIRRIDKVYELKIEYAIY